MQVDPKATQGMHMSPYNSMQNNPISFSDPNGDWIQVAVGAAIGGVTGYMSGGWEGALKGAAIGALNGAISWGVGSLAKSYSLTKFLSMGIAPQISLGTEGVTVGINATLGYKINGFNLGLNAGFSIGNMTGTGKGGAEGRLSAGVHRLVNGFDLSLSSNQFLSGATSQRTATLGIGYRSWQFSYENDGAPFPNGIFNDSKDRYRTAAAMIDFGGYVDLKMKIFTGSAQSSTGTISSNNGVYNSYGYYTGGDVDDYRLGALSIGSKRLLRGSVSNVRLGINSENVRHAFQNQLAHSIIKPQPQFRVLDWKVRFYGISGSSNPFTHW